MIELELGPPQCQPGQDVSGTVGWSDLVGSLEVRLLWHSQSPLGRQVVSLACERIPHPGASGSRLLRWKLPAGPYSFVAANSQLNWAVEALAGKESATWPFELGPQGKALKL